MEEKNLDIYKKLIEDLFAKIDIPTIEEEKPQEESVPWTEAKKKRQEIKKEVVKDTSDEGITEFCRKKSTEELELVREAFIEFQDKIKDLVVTEYLAGQIAGFAEYAINMVELIDDELDESELDPALQQKLKTLKKLRAQLFSGIYNKYKKK